MKRTKESEVNYNCWPFSMFVNFSLSEILDEKISTFFEPDEKANYIFNARDYVNQMSVIKQDAINILVINIWPTFDNLCL